MMVVNGRTWPYLEVERKPSRFRLLNGCNSRFLLLKMTTSPWADNASFNASEQQFLQIGADQGFLPEAQWLDQLLVAPAERADVIVDFSNVPANTDIYLVNDGPDSPFGGNPDVGDLGREPDLIADHASTGQVMQFRVVNRDDLPVGQIPTALPAATPLGMAPNNFNVTLNEEVDNLGNDIPSAALLGSGTTEGGLLWGDNITENPALGSTEEWSLYNFTEDAHPIHVHLVQFQVVGRVPFGGGTSTAGSNDPSLGRPGSRTR